MTAEQFSAIVRETQGGFRRYLVALCCGDRQLADDVAQEAYVKAYLSIDTLRDSASFAAWLRRIGYNVFVSQQRGTVQAVGYDHPEAMQSPRPAGPMMRSGMRNFMKPSGICRPRNALRCSSTIWRGMRSVKWLR